MVSGLITLGEAMAVVRLTEAGPVRVGAHAVLDVAGAEATVAVGVRRLGHPATWIGRVGADPLGDMVLAALRAEDLDVRCPDPDPDRPTGLLLRERRTHDRVRVSYLRRGSAGSALRPEDVPTDAVRTAGVLHVTGITPALSPSAVEAVQHAVAVARAAGTPVSFDVNHRSALWAHDAARPVLRTLAGSADVLFAGPAEAAVLGVAGDADEAGDVDGLVDGLLALGPSEVVVMRGAAGAVGATSAGTWAVDAVRVTVADVVGAGDAFVAGYLSGLLDGASVPERLALGSRCAAFVVSTPGDHHGLPTRAELALLSGPDVMR